LLAIAISFAEQSPGVAKNNSCGGQVGGRVQRYSDRLPSSVVPDHYRLFFNPDLKNGTFTGEETLFLTATAPVGEIILHSLDLHIDKARIFKMGFSGPEHVLIPRIVNQPANERVQFAMPGNLAPGRYMLTLHFEGAMDKPLHGFYRGTCKDAQGKQAIFAATEFEPTYARAMFPCFDDPVDKAVFSLSTTIDANLTAISNAPVARTIVDAKANKKTVRFYSTPCISTYLVALFIGPFVSSDPLVVNAVPVRVWTIGHKEKLARYALQTTAKILPYLTEYFGVPYPERKLDLIALPEFEAAAMENLGAISFRENALLFNEAIDSDRTKFNIATILAHELSHMWFGDLVTMQWWDDLWLNEAFATWMSMKTVDALQPDWRAWEQFTLWKQEAMITDALKSSRAIRADVVKPSQALEMFDEITYEKGASILKMLEAYIGSNVFKQGIQNYIKTHMNGNCATSDLWNALATQTTKPIERVMRNWVSLPGFPLISVAPKSDGSISISQRRFFLNTSIYADTSKTSPLWQVPIVFRPLLEKARKASTVILLSRQSQLEKLHSSFSGFVANAGSPGYFKILYQEPLLKRLEQQSNSALAPVERLTLLEDQGSLAQAGYIRIDDYLELAQKCKDEQDPIVIRALIGQLYGLNELIEDRTRPLFAAYVRQLLTPSKLRLSWQPSAKDSYLIKLARSSVLCAMGTIGQDSKTIEEARLYFNEYLQKPDSLDRNLVDAVQTIVAFNGDATCFGQLKNCWLHAPSPELEEQALMSLGAFREPDLIDEALNLSISSDVKSQDGPLILARVLESEAGRHRALKFLTEHWDKLVTVYPPHLLICVINAASSLSTREEEMQLKALFESRDIPAGRIQMAQTLERIENNVAFMTRSAADLDHWLSTNIASERVTTN
jgi:puromycin-sensitive aminopeptidase